MDLCQLLPTQFSKNINLSSKKIVTIGKLASNSPFFQIENLHLSHNNISQLDGMEQFKSLKSLSISNNQMSDIDELKKVNKNLQYLTLHTNPFTVYDYSDVCYNLFPKLKRLDGMAVDMLQVKQQRINAENVSRWFIPFLLQVKQQIQNIQKVLQLRGTVKEINQNSQLKVIENDLLMQVNWQQIDTMLLLLNQQNLVNLSKQVSSHLYEQELDAAQTRDMKKLHYETFLDLIKLQSANHYTAFIDYLLRLSDGGDYYKVFLKIQKPQLHISSDLYSKDDDTFIEQDSQKIKQTVPVFLQDKIKCQDVISNTYRKDRVIPNYEKEHFYQYMPVFPFRQEYIQSVIQIAVLKLTELKNLVSQIAYLKQTPMSSMPQSVRTLRKKQKNVDQPAPEKLSLKPSKLEISPREEEFQPQNEKPTVRHYNEVKSEIIRAQHTNKLYNSLQKIINRRLKRYFGRIQNPDQENTRFFDFPELVYLQSIWDGFKRVLERQKKKRQKRKNKKLLFLAFQGLKFQKQFKKKEFKRVNKGYQILQKIYFKRLVDGLRSMRSLLNPVWKVRQIKPFRLELKQAPFQESSKTLIKFKCYDENAENMKTCSVCNYDFSKLRENQ